MCVYIYISIDRYRYIIHLFSQWETFIQYLLCVCTILGAEVIAVRRTRQNSPDIMSLHSSGRGDQWGKKINQINQGYLMIHAREKMQQITMTWNDKRFHIFA